MTDALAVCRRAYEAYSEGDFPRLLTFFHPDIEVFVAPPNFEAGTYRGHEEYTALIERWGSAWDQMRIEPRDLSVTGNWVLARVDYRGRGKGSSIEVTQPSWEVSRWVDGLCRRYEVYWDQENGAAAFERRGGC